MSARVYMLLNISKGNSIQVLKTLKGQKGVMIADMLEGPPDIVLMIKAPDRQKLADRAIRAVASVEDKVENIRLLPTTMDSNASNIRRKRMGKETARTI